MTMVNFVLASSLAVPCIHRHSIQRGETRDMLKGQDHPKLIVNTSIL